jgi:hypothetical protein
MLEECVRPAASRVRESVARSGKSRIQEGRDQGHGMLALIAERTGTVGLDHSPIRRNADARLVVSVRRAVDTSLELEYGAEIPDAPVIDHSFPRRIVEAAIQDAPGELPPPVSLLERAPHRQLGWNTGSCHRRFELLFRVAIGSDAVAADL